MLKRKIYKSETIFEYDDTDCKIKNTFKFSLGNLTIDFQKGKTLKMQLVLPDDSQVSFVLPGTGLDAKGNPTTLKTPPTISVSDTTMLTLVQPDPATPDNPLSGVLSAVGPIGTAQFVVKDDDDATQPLMVVVDIQIVAGETVSLSPPSFGPITKQVVPTPTPTPPADNPPVVPSDVPQVPPPLS